MTDEQPPKPRQARGRFIGYGPAEPLIGLCAVAYAGFLTSKVIVGREWGGIWSVAGWWLIAALILSQTALVLNRWVIRSPIWGLPVIRTGHSFSAWVVWRVWVVGSSSGVFCSLTWHSHPSSDAIVTGTLERIRQILESDERK